MVCGFVLGGFDGNSICKGSMGRLIWRGLMGLEVLCGSIIKGWWYCFGLYGDVMFICIYFGVGR
jgi:hypothetical protein